MENSITREEFWETGVHPVTGYIVPSFASDGNTTQKMKRIANRKQTRQAIWGRK